MEEQLQQTNKSYKVVISIVIFATITAFFVGMAVFVWQQSRVNQVARNYAQQNQELILQINELQSQLDKQDQSIKYCNDENNFIDCVDKNILVKGVISKKVSQHPIIPPPTISSPKQFQNYIDTIYGQIILVSTEKIECEDNIEVTGILNIVEDVCGPDNNVGKCSYKGYYIEVDTWRCESN